MVRYDASPDDPDLRSYWEQRAARKAELLPSWRHRELAKRQGGHCPICRDSLYNEEELHVHHVIPKSQGGGDAISNLALVHLYCHQQGPQRPSGESVTGLLEPYVVKITSTVLRGGMACRHAVPTRHPVGAASRPY